ncbi:unnamed protein product [Rotaria sordida]|uniref:CLLAC-motif containing domain-containing protein n=1 Tax=Rotaria sordida TaxID=392033 RepID=A0A819EKH8_9BILA|nr:unnamed protein product [Rotaria sordida]
MATNVVVPSDYYSRHVLPKKIISNRPRQPEVISFNNFVANIDEVDEIPSTNQSKLDFNKSQRWNRSSAILGSIPPCCKCGMITAILILIVGLIIAMVLLFTLPRNQTNDSNVANTSTSSSTGLGNTSMTPSTVPGTNATTTGGASSISATTVANTSDPSTTSLASTSITPSTVSGTNATTTGGTSSISAATDKLMFHHENCYYILNCG